MASNREPTTPEGAPPKKCEMPKRGTKPGASSSPGSPISDTSFMSPTMAARLAEDFAFISPTMVARLSDGFGPDPAPVTPEGAAPEPYQMARQGAKRGISPPSPTPAPKRRINAVVPQLGEPIYRDLTPGEGASSEFQHYGEDNVGYIFGEDTVGNLFEEGTATDLFGVSPSPFAAPAVATTESSSSASLQPQIQQPSDPGSQGHLRQCTFTIPAKRGERAHGCNNKFIPTTMNQTHCYVHSAHQPVLRATQVSDSQLTQSASSAPGNLQCAFIFPNHASPTEPAGDRCGRVFLPERMGQIFCNIHDKRNQRPELVASWPLIRHKI